jgi:integrase
MAEHIKVTLEHHVNRRYHAIKHGAGRRPATVTYGNFNLRYRDPKLDRKRVRMSLDVRDLTSALEARREKEFELNAVPAESTPKRTLRRAADEYLAEIKATRKKETHQAYSVALKYFAEVVSGDKSVAEITRGDILDYRVYLREEKKQEPRSEWNKFSNVMGFLKMQGVRPGVTKHDWPKYVEEEPEIYEEQQLETFFAACDEHERLMYEFFLQTGMREQEVVHATDRCIDFANYTVSVRHNREYGWTPKMYKERTIPVPEALVQKLKRMLVERGKDGLLFPTREGLPQHHFLEMAKSIAKRAGLDENEVWLHKFRSTFCSRSLWGGVDVGTVQMWMGHTDLASTMRDMKPQRGKQVREKVEAIWA